MRITNNMLVNNLISNVNKNLVNMSKMQDQLASGKKVHSASDDPVAASKIIKYKTDLAEYAQYERNTNDALSWLETTESTMMDINKVLQRAREIAVKGSNGTNTDEDVEKIGQELEQLKKQLIMDGNFSFAGRYVFSGYHTEEELFNKDGTYKIGMTDIDLNNPPIKKYQIGVGEDIQISTNGLDIFGSVAETGVFVETMPSGKDTDEALIRQSQLTIDLSLDMDHSALPITFEFDGNNYELDMTSLDLSSLDMNDPAQVEAAKATIISAVNDAQIVPATTPATKLSSVVDVSFNDDNELVIKSKENGNFSLSQVSATGFKDRDSGGLSVEASIASVTGDTIATESKQSELIINFDTNIDYSNSSITYEVNGVNYDLDMSGLDLSTVDNTVDTEVQEARNKIIDAIKNAVANPATVPQTKLLDTADVYFTDMNQLAIRSKEYGAITISQVSSDGFKENNDILVVDAGGISDVSNSALVANRATEGDYTIETSIDVEGADNGTGNLSSVISNIQIDESSLYDNGSGFQIRMDQNAQIGGTGSESYTFTLVNGNPADTTSVTMSASSGTTSVVLGDISFDVDIPALWATDTNDDSNADSALDGNVIDLTILNKVTMTQVSTGDAVVKTVAGGATETTTNYQFADGGEMRLSVTDDAGEFIRGATYNTNVTYTDAEKGTFSSIGNDLVQVYLSTSVINDSDVGTNFNGKEFVVTLNGDTQRIKIGELPEDAVRSDLVIAMQSAIDEKFSDDKLIVSEVNGEIRFTSNDPVNDGETPSLEILPVKSMKSQMIQDFDDVIDAIKNGDREVVSNFIEKMDDHMGKTLTNLADIGARTNRMELVISRINENNITFTKLLSNSQDADMSEVIMYLKNAENVYNASLSTGAKVIQPTLVDFLR